MSKRITEKDKEFAIYLYQEKRMNAQQVAASIGIGKTSVYNILKDAGITPHRPATSEANRKHRAEPKAEQLTIPIEDEPRLPDNTDTAILRLIENQERIITLLTELNEGLKKLNKSWE